MLKGRILVVDDEEIILMGIKGELEACGHEVVTVSNGKQALELVSEARFDIAFVDLVMPGLNGVEVCKGIKKEHPDTEVVLISGHPSEIFKYQMDFYKAGGRDEVLRKPFVLGNELSRVVDNILREKEGK
ncbi:MAG: response regulator [Candidatus Omnitrophica bacterium]|nr:response regulator [Candidatus Omnitrophota bacterium]MDD5487830.1 response regulator [Candidatus Omnitrophota bacterium]